MQLLERTSGTPPRVAVSLRLSPILASKQASKREVFASPTRRESFTCFAFAVQSDQGPILREGGRPQGHGVSPHPLQSSTRERREPVLAAKFGSQGPLGLSPWKLGQQGAFRTSWRNPRKLNSIGDHQHRLHMAKRADFRAFEHREDWEVAGGKLQVFLSRLCLRYLMRFGPVTQGKTIKVDLLGLSMCL